MFRRYDQEAAYRALQISQPTWFADGGGNGIEIVSDKKEAESAVQSMASSLPKKTPKNWQRTGVLYQDSFFTFVKDAVRFPDKRLGTYIRLMLSKPSAPGVAIFPFLGDKIVLVRQFRHATRNFHLAIPRGFGEPGETPEISARRELKEEVGGDLLTIEQLGTLHPDSGILGYNVTLFRAQLSGNLMPQKSEAIESIILLDPNEFCEKIASDEITDAFTIAGFGRLVISGKL